MYVADGSGYSLQNCVHHSLKLSRGRGYSIWKLHKLVEPPVVPVTAASWIKLDSFVIMGGGVDPKILRHQDQ